VILRVRNACASKNLYDEKKRALEKLQELEALRDNLTHMIVHDMRSPLTGIKGFLELLKLKIESKLDNKELGFLNNAYDATKTLVDMVTDLLDVSCLENEKMPLEKGHYDVSQIVKGSISTLNILGESVVFKAPSAEVTLLCDSQVISRVVINLIANSVKFSPKGTNVRVKIAENDSNIRLSVIDQGPGIAKEYHSKIFEKFGQVEMKEENKKFSTGLGLTFCKLAVEAHGGRIGINSELGKGSTFWFELPKDS